MLSAILAFIGAIPGIGAVIQFIVGKVFDSKVAITTATIGGDRDVAVALVKKAATDEHERTSQLGLIAGSNTLMVLVFAFAAPLVIYEWKVVVVDIVLQAGSTDPIRGQVADWANTIIAFVFGASTTMALGHMWFNRK
jgi:hypothetical protein